MRHLVSDLKCRFADYVQLALQLFAMRVANVLLLLTPASRAMPSGKYAQKNEGHKRPADDVSNAVHVMKIATREIAEELTEDGKSRAAVELGRKGGRARAKSVSAKRRKQIAETAAATRWKKGSLCYASEMKRNFGMPSKWRRLWVTSGMSWCIAQAAIHRSLFSNVRKEPSGVLTSHRDAHARHTPRSYGITVTVRIDSSSLAMLSAPQWRKRAP
jgi:hypothetical protein